MRTTDFGENAEGGKRNLTCGTLNSIWEKMGDYPHDTLSNSDTLMSMTSSLTAHVAAGK